MEIRFDLSLAEWASVFSELSPSRRDTYFSPAYASLNEASGASRPFAVLARDRTAFLLVTGQHTPIENSGLADLQTGNGYGGPVCSSSADEAFLERAWAKLLQECARQGLVACFFRLHPLLRNEQWMPDGALVVDNRQTIYIDLREGLEVVWLQARSQHRNMVRKARADGHKVIWNHPADWTAFPTLYAEAMDRIGAPAELRFKSHYFDRLRRLTGAQIAAVRTGQGLAVGAVFLMGEKVWHYHLMARRSFAGNTLGNFVLQAAIERAFLEGKDGLHLGGGKTVDPKDSLLSFKASLGGQRLPFRIARIVVDASAYEALLADWKAAAGREPSWLLGYREPLGSPSK